MTQYRCYLMNVGHIVGVELVEAPDDSHAVEKAKLVFEGRKAHCSGFELWEQARCVHRGLDARLSA